DLRLMQGGHLLHHLSQLAGGIATRHFVERNRLDLAGIAGSAKLLVALETDLLGSKTCGLEVFAWVELGRVLGHETTDGAGHSQADVGIDIDLAHTELDRFLDFFNRYAVRFFHVAAKLTDFRQQVLRYA